VDGLPRNGWTESIGMGGRLRPELPAGITRNTQADIRFLSMIKKMGILENIVFVINCDFSEHETVDDLNDLVERVREELAMLKPNPQIYTFSALFNLFRASSDTLSEKDRLRLAQWQADETFTDQSNREIDRFESGFHDILARKRLALSLQNHIERLAVIVAGLGDWSGLNRNVLAKDADSAADLLKKIKKHQKRLNKIKSTIKKTLAGSLPEIKNLLQQEVHRFFDSHSGSVNKKIVNFINSYALETNKYQNSLNEIDFSQILYLLFQDFKQSIDSHITEAINPELIRFVQMNENRIGEYFESTILPFESVMEEALQEFNGVSASSEGVANGGPRSRIRPQTIEAVVKASGLRPPALVAATHYSARIKAEAIMRLGYYKAMRKSKAIFKKSAQQRQEVEFKAMEDALRRMKRETERSVVFHLKDYRENLKFRYFFKLAEAACDNFARSVLEQFQAYFSDLSATIERIGSSQSDKEKTMRIIDDIERQSQKLVDNINRIRGEIDNAG